MKQIILDNYEFEDQIQQIDKFETILKPFFQINFECLFNSILAHSINDLKEKLNDDINNQIDGDHLIIYDQLTDHQKIDLTRYYEDYEKLDFEDIDSYLNGMSFYALDMVIHHMVNNFCDQINDLLDEFDLDLESLSTDLENHQFELKIEGFSLYINSNT